MRLIKTIDLWTEQYKNQHECFNGAFIDGFANDIVPYDEYKIIKNCNCRITTDNDKFNISNKHNVIVFYKKNPVRLLVINKDTDIDCCINIALNQFFKNTTLMDFFTYISIVKSTIDMSEQATYNNADISKEIDVGSCDRWNLLFSMLKGSYTEDDTPFGHYQCDKYTFIPNITLSYELITDTEKFEIQHNCAFANELYTRLIPIQKDSKLTN